MIEELSARTFSIQLNIFSSPTKQDQEPRDDLTLFGIAVAIAAAAGFL
jgi:hypothetical protein